MPNWCNNTITIEGPKAKIKAIWDKANQENSGLLEAMVPMPRETFTGDLGEKERKECEAKGIPNWYDWSIANWGTKWDVDISEGLEYVEPEDMGDNAQITGWFDSAWAPPVQAYDTFLEANPDCSISSTYEEGGMDFAGVYDDGEDEYMEDIHGWCRRVISGETELEDTPPLFQRLNYELDLIENREEWVLEEMEIEKAKEA